MKSREEKHREEKVHNGNTVNQLFKINIFFLNGAILLNFFPVRKRWLEFGTMSGGRLIHIWSHSIGGCACREFSCMCESKYTTEWLKRNILSQKNVLMCHFFDTVHEFSPHECRNKITKSEIR